MKTTSLFENGHTLSSSALQLSLLARVKTLSGQRPTNLDIYYSNVQIMKFVGKMPLFAGHDSHVR